MVPSIPVPFYSSTSSPDLDAHRIVHFAFLLVDNWLGMSSFTRSFKYVLAGDVVDILYLFPLQYDETSHFRPQESVDTKYIMIEAGTVVDPFRDFLRERQDEAFIFRIQLFTIRKGLYIQLVSTRMVGGKLFLAKE